MMRLPVYLLNFIKKIHKFFNDNFRLFNWKKMISIFYYLLSAILG